MKSAMADLKMDASFAERNVNEGLLGRREEAARDPAAGAAQAEDRHP
jgi:Fe-S cluster assembly ATPase SufC